MAIFDRSTGRIVIRVVYDGPGNAGKSTNVRQLREFFTPLRRSELYVPEERNGRTMYFDWLQIESGLVAGHRLRCEALSVPGQLVLRERRGRLLQTADVVVMVCESSREGAERVRRSFARTRAYLREVLGPDLPVLVQANKQDLPDAVGIEELAELLMLEPEVPVIAARADQGIGVRETAVLAIRAAADRVQRAVLRDGLDAIAGEVVSPEALHEELRSAEIGSADARSSVALLDDDIDDEGELAPAPPPSRASTPRPPPLAARLPPPSALAVPRPMAVGRERLKPPTGWPEPPLDRSIVPRGLMWPSATGREALRRIAESVAEPAIDGLVASGALHESGEPGLVLYRAGAYCLKTTLRRRFRSLDDARAALVRLVRDKLALGAWAPAETVLVATEASNGYWLWTVSPWLETLQARLVRARRARDEAALAAALARFAVAAVGALRLRAETDLLLDVHPSNFAESGRGIVYLDDEVQRSRSAFPIAHALVQRVEECAGSEAAVGAYVAAISAELAMLSREEQEALSLRAHLVALTPRTCAAVRARDALLATLHGELQLAPVGCEVPLVLELDPDDWSGPDAGPGEERTHADPVGPPALAALPSATIARSPPLPRSAEELPSGFIWPPARGRELVRRILGRGPLAPPTLRGDARASLELADGLRMSTSPSERYGDADEARAALAQRARRQVALRGLEDDVVFMLVPSTEDGSCWIWTIHGAEGESA